MKYSPSLDSSNDIIPWYNSFSPDSSNSYISSSIDLSDISSNLVNEALLEEMVSLLKGIK